MNLLAPPGHVTTAIARDFAEFERAASTSFVPLHISTGRAAPFRGRIRSCDVDGMTVSAIDAGGHVVERTTELISDRDRHYYKVSLLLRGTGVLMQDGREARLEPGDLAIYDTRRPYTLVFEEPFRSAVVMVPPGLVDLPPELVGQLTAVRLSAREGVGTMVVPFLAQLSGHLDQLEGASGVRLVRGAMSLVTAMLAGELGESPATRQQDLLQRIHSYIESNLACPDLGPARIAGAHYISTRRLHSLFRGEDVTVSAWIRSRRLERCRRDLADPVNSALTVSAIAGRWGFSDAAHFSRVFKAAFGHSPSELRPAVRATA